MLNPERLLGGGVGRVRSQNIANLTTKLLRRQSLIKANIKNLAEFVFHEIVIFAVRPQALLWEEFRRDFQLKPSMLLF
jgi:hypothetical protein